MASVDVERRLNPLAKVLLELGPLGVFFFANARFGIFWATGAFMAALVVSLVVMYLLARRLPVLPLVTGIFVLVFGGLTLALQDEYFFKIKPTVINVFFGVILLGGMLAGKSFLKSILDEAFAMDDAGWRKLTWRWAVFFFFLAAANEVVWRNFTTDQWVDFKVFAIMPLTVLFSMTQLPTMLRHRIAEEEAD